MPPVQSEAADTIRSLYMEFLADLLVPSYVRDLPLSILGPGQGKNAPREEDQPYSDTSGYGIPSLWLDGPGRYIETIEPVIDKLRDIGGGDVHAGAEKLLEVWDEVLKAPGMNSAV